MLNQCRNSVINTDPELIQHRASVSTYSTGYFLGAWATLQAPFKSWPSVYETEPTRKKRHPLNGSCSPVRCDNSVLSQQTRGSDPPLGQCCNDVEDAVPTLQQHRTKASSPPESDTCDTIARLTAIVSQAQYKSTNRTHLCRTAYLWLEYEYLEMNRLIAETMD